MPFHAMTDPSNLGPSFPQFAHALSNWLDPELIKAHINMIREDYVCGFDLMLTADRLADRLLDVYEPGDPIHEAARQRNLCDLSSLDAI